MSSVPRTSINIHDNQTKPSFGYILKPAYSFNESHRVWARSGYDSIAYSDGDSAENRLFEVVSNARDLSVLSSELRQHCTDWPTRYHLSSSRANVLRPFEETLKGDILEIGSGCGAITRYLGECGANVLSLEGSLRRARIGRARTRDLTNVTVLAERFSDFETTETFDVITLIGVLEYANLFTSAPNAPLAILKRIKSVLKPGGQLFIAIENQLGLKYFAGALEDHVGVPMFGIENRYTANSVRTFGKLELQDLLKEAGFLQSSFLACFPDYKLPRSIVTEKGINNRGFDAASLACQSTAQDHLKPACRCFSSELAWPTIMRNGLGMDLANSFLVCAGTELGDPQLNPSALAFHYSSERLPRFTKETRFVLEPAGNIITIFRGLDHSHQHAPLKAQDQTGSVKFEVPKKAPYVHGQTLSQSFVDIVTRDGWSFKELGCYFRVYLNILASIAGSDIKNLKESTLPGSLIDCTPNNLIKRNDEGFEFIDAEWSVSTEIPVRQLLFRSLLSVVFMPSGYAKDQAEKIYTYQEFFLNIYRELGLLLEPKDLVSMLSVELDFQEKVQGYKQEFFQNTTFVNALMPGYKYFELLGEQAAQLSSVTSELAAIKSSRKWRCALRLWALVPGFVKQFGSSAAT